MQDCRAAYLALKHSFECMNPELNPFSIHRPAICRQALAASAATEQLYADLRKVSHAKWTSDSAWPGWASIAAVKVVGIGSVGTTCFVLLFMAGEGDSLFPQVK